MDARPEKYEINGYYRPYPDKSGGKIHGKKNWRRSYKRDPEYSSLLEKERKAQNLSINDLAKSANVSKGTISHYEKMPHIPNFDTAEKIANALGIAIEELFKDKIKTTLPNAQEHTKPPLMRIRTERNITRLELARSVNMSKGSILSYETGMKKPNVVIAKKIAQALDTTIEKLFFEQEAEQMPPSCNSRGRSDETKPIGFERYCQLRDIKPLDIAKIIGVSAEMVRKYQIGSCLPNLRTAQRIARALNTTVEEIFPFSVD